MKFTTLINLLIGVMLCGWTTWADVSVTALPDRNQISQDESLALKFNIRGDQNFKIDSLRFNAPDFEEINEYSGQFVESYYENGNFGLRRTQSVTKVLRPKRTGALKIDRIEVRVDGKKYEPQAVIVQVEAGLGGNAAPRGFGGNAPQLRGSKKGSLQGVGFFIRAEADKTKVYKGEQVVVGYYLYRRVKVFNVSVDKFPVLSGFLREDLDIPVMSPRLDCQRSILNGVAYDKCLLAKYAAYPLKEGRLPVDPMTIKAAYYVGGANDDDEMPFMNFFNQMAPRQGVVTSEPLTIVVSALPQAGRSDDFSGGVGEFSVSAAIDKTEVRANEPVNLTVKIEGKGNVAAIEEPKVKWPEGVEVYETKGHAKSSRTGVSEKIFEILLIPRTPGSVTLPGVGFTFFDPRTQSYVKKTTEPFVLKVNDPLPGTQVFKKPVSKENETSAPEASNSGSDFIPLSEGSFSKILSSKVLNHPIWIGFALTGLIGFLVLSGLRTFRKWMNKKSADPTRVRAKVSAKKWQRLKALGQAASNSNELTESYELLMGILYDAIDTKINHAGARSLPRNELRRLLVEEAGVREEVWNSLSKILEYGEMVRFASRAGAVTENQALERLKSLIQEGEILESALSK